jgi:Ca2+-binding EF-hand superfamily protein
VLDLISRKYIILYTGVTILRLKPDGSFAFIAGTGLSAERQLQTETSLSPGKYLVVPTCSGAKFRQWSEKARSVRSDTEDPLLIMVDASCGTEDLRGLSPALGTLDSAELQDVVYDSTKRECRIRDIVGKKIVLSPKLDAVLDEIFRRLDADSDGLLNFEELNAFMLLTEGSELEPKLFEWLVGTFDSSHQCKLTSRGFKDAQTYMFCKLDAQERRETIMQDLNVFGYDSDMMLTTARAVSVTIHGELNYEVKAVDHDPAAFRAAMELPVKSLGTVTEYDGPVRLYALKAGEFGMSVVVENAINSSSTWKSTGKADLDLLFQLDCSESSAIVSHATSLRTTQRISVGETRALHHVFPSDDWGDRDWDMVYSASMKWDTS